MIRSWSPPLTVWPADYAFPQLHHIAPLVDGQVTPVSLASVGSMPTYEGNATILDGDAVIGEYRVHLTGHVRWIDAGTERVRGLTDWSGFLVDKGDKVSSRVGQGLKIRIDDREGEVLVSGAQIGTGRVDLAGSGQAPFDIDD